MNQNAQEIRIVPGMSSGARQTALRSLAELTMQPIEPKLASAKGLRVLISPHMARQIRQVRANGDEPGARALLRTVVPSPLELEDRATEGWRLDGTGTVYHRKEFNLPDMAQPLCIRRLYPDRAILTPSWQCPVLCRYCFRKCEAGSNRRIDLRPGLDYIRTWNKSGKTPIRDVILSGGDPLSLSDAELDALLPQIRSIPGVEFVRIDTKYPTAKPERITRGLLEVLEERVDIMMLHFTHPLEICEETIDACRRLSKRGIILRSYTPLLKGVNDDRETLKRLFWDLLSKCGVTPYYAVQFIETPGARHFRIPLSHTLELMRGLHVELSGTAIPNSIVYLPDGGGKYVLGPHERILYPNEPGTGIRKVDGGYQIPAPLKPGELSFYPD